MATKYPRGLPKITIQYAIGKFSVAEPDAVVAKHIATSVARAAKRDPRWTPALRQAAVAYAIDQHHRNQDEYAQVMAGRKRWPR